MYLPLIFLWFRWFAWHMIMSQPQQSFRGKLRREIRTGMLQLHLRVGIAARNQARGEEMAWSMCWGVVWKLSLSGTCHQCLMCNRNNWADFWEHSETVTLTIYTHWISRRVIRLLWLGPKLPLHNVPEMHSSLHDLGNRRGAWSRSCHGHFPRLRSARCCRRSGEAVGRWWQQHLPGAGFVHLRTEEILVPSQQGPHVL